jgi:hypothetical protein
LNQHDALLHQIFSDLDELRQCSLRCFFTAHDGAHHIAPDIHGQNFYAIDRQFQDLMSLYMEPGARTAINPHFDRLGALAGDVARFGEVLAGQADPGTWALRIIGLLATVAVVWLVVVVTVVLLPLALVLALAPLLARACCADTKRLL